MSATVYDVAREANVSIATVSRVVNKQGNVSAATVDSVLMAAKRLNYLPNASARSLMSKKTGIIGVVLPDMHGAFFSEFVRAVDTYANKKDMHLLLSSSHDNSDNMAAGLTAMCGKVDGVIIMSPLITTQHVSKLTPQGLPIVLLNCENRKTSCFPAINFDNFKGASDMTKHLINIGHRNIVFITGPEANREAQNRREGYEAVMSEHGLEVDFLSGDFSEQSGYEAGNQIYQRNIRPDAIFAANDAMAIGCLSSFKANGIQTPDDIALAGFDDIVVARHTSPTLTTVTIPIEQMGELAFDRLLRELESLQAEPKSRRIRVLSLPPTLVIRESCGAKA